MHDRQNCRYTGGNHTEIQRPYLILMQCIYRNRTGAQQKCHTGNLLQNLWQCINFHVLESLIEAADTGKQRNEKQGKGNQYQYHLHRFNAVSFIRHNKCSQRRGKQNYDNHHPEAEAGHQGCGQLFDQQWGLIVPSCGIFCDQCRNRKRKACCTDIQQIGIYIEGYSVIGQIVRCSQHGIIRDCIEQSNEFCKKDAGRADQPSCYNRLLPFGNIHILTHITYPF